MAVSRNLSAVITTGFNDEGLKKAQKSLENLGSKMSSLGSKAIKLGASFVAFQGTRALVDFASGAIEQSRDLERNMNGLAAVFGELTPQMVDFSEKSVNMGLSQSEAAKSITFIGSVLKQSGFAIGETADLTERLIKLGTDLSITYGYDVQEALLGMTALFRGEYDPIEKFGVAMKQSEIESVKAARGLDKLTGAGERLADQQIRLELLFERSADAQGQYEKQSGSLFVAQQNLEATFKNMQATAGRVLTPAFADLTLAMTPLVERLTPVLAQIMQGLVPIVVNVANNTDALEKVIKDLANGIVFSIDMFGKLFSLVANNLVTFKNLTIIIASLTVAAKGIQAVTFAMQLFTIATGAATVALKGLRLALAATGVGIVAVGVGFLASKLMEATDTSGDFSDTLPDLNLQLGQTAEAAALAAEKVQYFKAGLSMSAAEYATRDFKFEAPDLGLPETTDGAVTQKVRDYVADFYANLKDEAAKQNAKLKLENLGASSGLIDSILGSGEEWKKVFNDVIKEGAKSVAAAQLMFIKTADGLDEITAKVEEDNEKLKQAYEQQKQIYDDAVKAFEDFEIAANEAGDAFSDFLAEMSTLSTFESAMGKFESAVVSDLTSIEQKLDDAFDNGYLLDESYKNLQNYVRSEYVALQTIARQRDALLQRRNLADALLKDVKNATIAAGNITNLLQDTQTETNKIDMTKVVQDTVQAGKNMKDFRVTIISDFVEPIEEAANKSELLVSGFRSVVERTKLFVDNLKALRQLGLDPLLFNQLVEAGVEAGGETAQALIDGGSDTVNEVNSLFGQLDALGQELGENTAQVMYGEGQEFVNGIIEGLDSMLGDLEDTATLLADSFVDTFSSILAAGIAQAVAAAKAAVPAAPAAPVYKKVEQVVQETKEALEEVAGVAEETVKAVEKVVSGTSTASTAVKKVAETVPTPKKISEAKVLYTSPTNAQMAAIAADKKSTSAMFRTVDSAFYGATSGQARTTINLTVNANSRTQGAQAGQEVVKQLGKYESVSGLTGLSRLLK